MKTPHHANVGCVSTHHPLICFLILLLLPIRSLAAPPTLSHPLPSAASPGQTTRITFHGSSLSRPTLLWTSFPCQSTLISSTPDEATYDLTLPPSASPGLAAVRLINPSGISSLLPLFIDDLPTTSKPPASHSLKTAQPLTLPCAIDGACDELSFNYYQFTAKKGQRLSVDIVAARLGSRLDPVIRLLDSAGRELLYCDDDPTVAPDARFTMQFPADGIYFLELRDSSYEGGPQYRYRLRIGDFPLSSEKTQPPTSNHTLATATPLPIPTALPGQFDQPNPRDYYSFTAKKADRIEFRAATRTLRSPCDATLELLKSDGSPLAQSKPTDPGDAFLTHTFAESGAYYLLVEELNHRGGPDLFYHLSSIPNPPGFSFALDTDKISAPPGGEFTLKVAAARREYKGKITLSVEADGRPLSVSSAQIADGKTDAETQLKVKLPPDLKPGQLLHLKVLGHPATTPPSTPAIASTAPALKKTFPRLLYPPPELDGLVALYILRPPEPTTKPAGR